MAAKHFVLVHAASHGAWSFYKVKPRLEAAGHKVTVMDLVASGRDFRSFNDITSLDDYNQPLIKIMEAIPSGEKVILVGGSFGGIDITIAADNYPQKISAVVYLNAFMPDTSNTPSYVVDKFNENPPDWLDSKFSTSSTGISTMLLGPNFMRTNMYQNCSAEDYELATMMTRWGSLFQEDLAKRANFTKEGYGSLTRVYIMGEEDKLLTKEFQLWQIANYKPKKVYTIPDGDHKIEFSKTERLVNLFLEIAATYA